MRGYDRYEYEDLDEYEEDGEEGEEAGEQEYEEEEDPQPTKEVLDYLELRQRLKEEKRKILKKESGAGSSRERKNVMSKPKDNYGSFFGPSQPVIAQRVIEESKSLLENPNVAARVMKSNQTVNKSSGSSSAGSKLQANGQRPKVTNVLQTKVQMLKNTRDYSFLLSDDAEVPVPSKDPPPRNVFPPKSEARTTPLPERRKDISSSNGRKVFNNREDKKPMPAVGKSQPRVANERLDSMDKHNRMPVDSRKMISGSNRKLADPRRQHSSSNGSGPGRPLASKGIPAKIPGGTAAKKPGIPAPRLPPTSGIQKPAPARSYHPVSKPPLIRKGESQESRKPNVLAKQMVPPPRPKVSRPPPRNSVRATVDDRPKKKPRRHDDEDVDDAISEIRKMFGYNPRRYADDDDDSDMEANFDDIMREEKRSAKIAREEDEEELRKIEEEERRERLRKEAKKRKMR